MTLESYVDQLNKDAKKKKAPDCCLHCRFWEIVNPPGSKLDPVFSHGQCRRRAPVIFQGPIRGTEWPETLGCQWCGEFEAR